MSKELLHAAISQNTEEFARIFAKEMCALRNKKEATMQVTYNGFTSSPVKLEKKTQPMFEKYFYDLSIYDSEKQVTHSFTLVKLEDVKFSGGEVSFGG